MIFRGVGGSEGVYFDPERHEKNLPIQNNIKQYMYFYLLFTHSSSLNRKMTPQTPQLPDLSIVSVS